MHARSASTATPRPETPFHGLCATKLALCVGKCSPAIGAGEPSNISTLAADADDWACAEHGDFRVDIRPVRGNGNRIDRRVDVAKRWSAANCAGLTHPRNCGNRSDTDLAINRPTPGLGAVLMCLGAVLDILARSERAEQLALVRGLAGVGDFSYSSIWSTGRCSRSSGRRSFHPSLPSDLGDADRARL